MSGQLSFDCPAGSVIVALRLENNEEDSILDDQDTFINAVEMRCRSVENGNVTNAIYIVI